MALNKEQCNRYIIRSSYDSDGEQILAGPLCQSDAEDAMRNAVIQWLKSYVSKTRHFCLPESTASCLWEQAKRPGGITYDKCHIVRNRDGTVFIRRSVGGYDDRFVTVRYDGGTEK